MAWIHSFVLILVNKGKWAMQAGDAAVVDNIDRDSATEQSGKIILTYITIV